MEDLNDHPMMLMRESEATDTPADRAWIRWAETVESIVRKSFPDIREGLDGDQSEDGYDSDALYDAYCDGLTPQEHADEILDVLRERQKLGL